MPKYYRINEVLQLTSVSLRTLHYYDEINLLSPSYRTEGGHRLYTNNDLLKLQQIVTLKFMGFSLKKIQQLLSDSTFNMHESLKIQAELVKKEALRMEAVSKLLEHMVCNGADKIVWEKLINIIEILQLNENDRQQWYQKYLTQSELDEMNELLSGYTDGFWKDYHKRWADLFAEVRQHLHTEPESEVGLQLARKWIELSKEVYAEKPELRKKLWDGYRAGIIPENQLEYDQEVISYISRACEKLK